MNLSRLKRLPARAKRAARYEIHARARRLPIVKGTVFYESFSGNGMLCNPEAIFRALLAADDMSRLVHIWALSDFGQYRSTIAEFAAMPNVRFVKYGSAAYYRVLATSEFLVNNATFPPDFSKRPGQTYLNTWHGTPLKRMGYDVEAGALAAANTLRNFVTADFLLAQNPFMADQMYETAYKLKGIYRGSIIEEGYPRVDRQRLSSAEVQAGRARLTDAGIALGDRSVILYAPTWKGASFRRPEDDIDQLLTAVTELQSRVDSSKYVVLLKTHQIVHTLAIGRPELQRVLVPNEIPTNVTLGLTDYLVTDYSSIFFDFLATGRPVLFFTPDLEDYTGSRGLYLEPDQWPGPVCRTIDEIAGHLEACIETGELPPESAERYRAARSSYCGFEDGSVTERVVDIVFRGKTDGYRIRTDFSDGRRSILLYLGGMRPNGITTSVLNLMNSIDHTKYDVSAFFAQSRYRAAVAKQLLINPQVRQFPRVGGMNGIKLDQVRRRLAFRRGRMDQHALDPIQNTLWNDEWSRCFGASEFEFVVDFSGYGPFWAALLLHSPPAIRSIWLHNDLAADAHRKVAGKQRMLRSLTAIFSLYRQYDRLVSVSPTLSEINRRNLSGYADPEKFVSALNTVEAERILRGAEADLTETTFDEETAQSPRWVQLLLTESPRTTFVTVGRLSPEKNHERMIRAFALVHAADPQTRLVIVGDGPLRAQLDELLLRLGLTDAVLLTGMQRNPFVIMKHADCFVLSSDYEGQPMVILEALVLGLPVVTVEFGSAGNALSKGSGLVVPQTVGGLAEGMAAFLAGEVPGSALDYLKYNKKAVRQFYRAIGATSLPNRVQTSTASESSSQRFSSSATDVSSS
ncbi:MAG: glycosyltransferase [Microbacteriaceae bacterium]